MENREIDKKESSNIFKAIINFLVVCLTPTFHRVSGHTLARLLGLTHARVDLQDLRPSRLAPTT